MIDKKKIEKAIKMILEAIGDDPQKPGLKETPQRVAKMYEEIFSGVGKEVAQEVKILTEDDHDEMVLIKDIPLYSCCEHHLTPFIGKAAVAYIPDGGRLTGLSKIARVVDTLSRRPQVQERLTTQIAETLMKTLKPKGVIVIIQAEHLCMSMRGIKKPGSLAVTSAVRGIFRENQKTRQEALALIVGNN